MEGWSQPAWFEHSLLDPCLLACLPDVKLLLSNHVERRDNSCRYTEASASVEAAVRVLNPGAEVIKTTRSEVPIELMLRTRKFDLADTSRSAGWLQRIRGQNKEAGGLIITQHAVVF